MFFFLHKNWSAFNRNSSLFIKNMTSFLLLLKVSPSHYQKIIQPTVTRINKLSSCPIERLTKQMEGGVSKINEPFTGPFINYENSRSCGKKNSIYLQNFVNFKLKFFVKIVNKFFVQIVLKFLINLKREKITQRKTLKKPTFQIIVQIIQIKKMNITARQIKRNVATFVLF
jgi:hypothetical protein